MDILTFENVSFTYALGERLWRKSIFLLRRAVFI